MAIELKIGTRGTNYCIPLLRISYMNMELGELVQFVFVQKIV